jgi:hypothetical protein
VIRQNPENWDGMGYQFVAQCPAEKKGTHYGEMFRANARLIAAAGSALPRLVRALRRARRGT